MCHMMAVQGHKRDEKSEVFFFKAVFKVPGEKGAWDQRPELLVWTARKEQ